MLAAISIPRFEDRIVALVLLISVIPVLDELQTGFRPLRRTAGHKYASDQKRLVAITRDEPDSLVSSHPLLSPPPFSRSQFSFSLPTRYRRKIYAEEARWTELSRPA